MQKQRNIKVHNRIVEEGSKYQKDKLNIFEAHSERIQSAFRAHSERIQIERNWGCGLGTGCLISVASIHPAIL